MNEKISIKLGPVELLTKNIKILSEFYVENVGLKVLSASEGSVLLGNENEEIIRLTEKPGLKTMEVNSVGLYHTAILFPTQSSLALTVKNLMNARPDLVVGSSDHLVSEAFYFIDPDGNGLELYFDRPRDKWPMKAGKPEMASLYIDPELYFTQHLDDNETANNVALKLGHLHLKVSEIERSKQFYEKILGFDVIHHFPTALFLSYDGYHHHLGMNIWESGNAGPLENNRLGIKCFDIKLLAPGLFEGFKEVLKVNNYPHTILDNGSITLLDPDGIEIRVTS